jgi:rSAM/selenodomain-associated transferase 1
MNRALIIVAKKPEPGRTKTRLSPPLSGEQAAALYHRFLLDTLELMEQVEIAQPILAYTPDEAEPFFRDLTPAGFELVPQVGADLGERLHNVLSHCLQTGYRQAVVMDSDSPTLPVGTLRLAFGRLDDPGIDVVFGPCEDGGYYLIGLKAPCAALFQNIPMSTPQVAAATLQRAREQGLRVAQLPNWYDVDLYADIERLREELRSLPTDRARHTRDFLAQSGIVKRYTEDH